MPGRTDRPVFGADRQKAVFFELSSSYSNIYETKPDDLKVILDRLACSSVVQWLFQ